MKIRRLWFCFITKTKTGLFGTQIKIGNSPRIVNSGIIKGILFIFYDCLTWLDIREFFERIVKKALLREDFISKQKHVKEDAFNI